MRRLILCLAAVASIAFPAAPAHAWDALGHRVVARIAWDHLTPEARQRAIELLASAPEDAGLRSLLPQDGRPSETRQAEWFTHAAVWPDLIRSREHAGHAYAASDWHYVNFFWEQPTPGGRAEERTDLDRAGRMLERLEHFGRTLGDASRPAAERAVELAWVMHLVGDAHQPLHSSARITAEEPEGDRGGNLFRLEDGNLHGYWDGILGPAYRWLPGDRDDAEYISRIARTIAEKHPRARLAGRLHGGDPEAWSQEGARIARESLYPPSLRRGRAPSAEYRAAARRIAERQIALAGYRLAEVLNRVLVA